MTPHLSCFRHPGPRRATGSLCGPALAAILLSTLTAAAGCRLPAAEVAEDEATTLYRQEIESWRQQREAGLTAEDGWLTVVELGWLNEGENRVGSGPDAAVVLPPDAAPPFVGTFERQGMATSFRPAIGGAELVSGAVAGDRVGPLRPGQAVTMAPDTTGDPTLIRLDGVRFYVIERGDRLGVRVKDPQSPARRGFTGIDSYPVDPGWRLEARLETHDPPRTVRVPNVLGTVSEEPSPGTAVFEIDGATHRLDAIPGGDGQLFFVFGDRTNGEGSYGGGRFLYADVPAPGEPLVLDFNRAYSPPCAFTAFATCPLPPRGNKLPVAIPAGERTYAGGAH